MISVMLAEQNAVSFDPANWLPANFLNGNLDWSVGARGIRLEAGKGNSLLLTGEFDFAGNTSPNPLDHVLAVEGLRLVVDGKAVLEMREIGLDWSNLITWGDFRNWLEAQGMSVLGNRFANTITGGTQDDRIVAGAGDDRLEGLTGDDRLAGSRGRDHLSGGEGADRFVFRRGDGQDRILDFDASGDGQDIIDLSQYGRIRFGQLDIHQTGKHVTIELDGGDTIVIQNCRTGEIDRSDFEF